MTEYTHIRNTLLNTTDLIEPVVNLLLSGKDVEVVADTTAGPIDVILSPLQWQQSAYATLVVNNEAGSFNINLVATEDNDAFARSAALQDALLLTTEGASVVIKILRYGSGTGNIQVNGTTVVSSTSPVGYALIQATSIDPGSETNSIVVVLSGGSGDYVDLTTAQTISGVKTFSAAPVISTITNSGSLTVPTGGGTLARIADIPTNTTYVDLTTAQTIAGVKTFSDQLAISSGSATVPSIAFSAETNTGIYRNGTNTVDVTVAGSRRFSLGGFGIRLSGLGSTTTPAYSFLTDTNTGLYSPGTDSLAFSCGGVQTITSTATQASVQVAGTAAAPALYFSTDTASGLYRPNANQIGIANSGSGNYIFSNASFTSSRDIVVSSGTVRTDTVQNSSGTGTLTLNSSGNITVPNATGTVALTSDIPTNATYVDLTTAQTISGVKTFSAAPVISTITNSGSLTVPTGGGTLARIADIPTNSTYVDRTTAQTIAGVKTFSDQLAISSGTVATPSVAFSAEPNTGIYQSGASSLDVSVAGSRRLSIDGSAVRFGATGTVTAPAYSFINDPNTGVYSNGTDSLAIACGGVRTLSSTLTQINVQVAGSAAAPALYLNADTTSGLYRPAANQIGISNSGSGNYIFSNTSFTSSRDIVVSSGTVRTDTVQNSSGTGTLTLNSSGNVTVPNATGTVALTSDIPTNATYVDLTTPQTITGVKTFSGIPIIPTISATDGINSLLQLNVAGTMTVPSGGNDTLVAQNAPATLTQKTLTSPSIATIVNSSGAFNLNTSGTITVPNGTDTLVGRATTDTLTNKTLSAPTITGTVTCSQMNVHTLTGFAKPPSSSGNGTSLGTVTLNGGKLLVQFVTSMFVLSPPGSPRQVTIELRLSTSPTPPGYLTAQSGSISMTFYINAVNTHYTTPMLSYTVASGNTGTYTAYLYSADISNLVSNSDDPYSVCITELPVA